MAKKPILKPCNEPKLVNCKDCSKCDIISKQTGYCKDYHIKMLVQFEMMVCIYFDLG
jgi:hypothetical protein